MSKLIINEELVERLLFRTFVSKPEIREKIFPFLDEKIFLKTNYKELFKIFKNHITTYGVFPNKGDIELAITSADLKNTIAEIRSVNLNDYTDDNLYDNIEIFIKKRSLWNELTGVFEKLKDNDEECLNLDIAKLERIKCFSFDDDIGIDVFEDDGSKFYEYINCKDVFLPTGMKQFDEISGGGLCRKAMTIIVSGVNRGKTALKCSLACDLLRQGRTVLFIPLEMPAEKIRDRIMVNMMDKTKDELLKMTKEQICSMFANLKHIIKTKLIIKDFNEHELNAHKLKNLLIELKEKKSFKPDVIFLDYLGLVSPNTLVVEGNSSFSLKRASEEFHAIAKEFDLHLFTSMQFNRKGYNADDPDMDDISESFATLFTADEVILLIQTDEMLKELRYIYKKVKARTPGKGLTGNFRVDYTKMRFYEDGDSFDVKAQAPKAARELQEMEEKIETFLTAEKKDDRIEELEFE
jgi:hypothetical protein